ncbi:F-box/LRR-repeat protein 3 [Heracleum sosnowskyi]|uniref:F-box/LRR-repeat protein 3 n=1 Tax=Heracleum sosnowskyi TaxID=360622 RepID=A0AAD8J5L5_9APIA|nr:F-box/LRR-repeat protein 3 [Heracleum sosnowskyi]
MKKIKASPDSNLSLFGHLSEELIFLILGHLKDSPFDSKSFSLVCKSFHKLESLHRKTLKPLHSKHIPKILNRYPCITDLDLSLCPRISDECLMGISIICKKMLRSINLSRSKFFTHLGLASLVKNCCSLVEIDLSNAEDLKDSSLAALAEAKNLERLCLARCKLITDIGIGCIAVGCRKLRFISLRWCLGVGDLGVGLIAVKCKEIQSLDLSYLPITEKCLQQVVKLEHLDHLVLEGCIAIDDDSLADLRLGFKAIKTLNISSCENVTHVGLYSLIHEPLRQLNLAYGSPVTLALANSLQKCSMLQSIKLDGCHVTCCGLKAIGNWCASLKELSLSKCMGVTDDGLSSLVTTHKDLKKLDITCCRKITHKSIVQITKYCSSLISLRMESCTLVPRESFVLIGQHCHFLEELDLTDNEVDDEGLKSISRCSKLSSLKLGICLNITDYGLTHIGMSCSKLTELDLYRCAAISDKGILAISDGCPDLQMINVAYCNDITDISLISMSKCSKIHTFESRGCALITSLGLAALAVGCKHLTKLDLKKCYRIDDFGMVPLAHFCQNLRQINLSYSSVTDVGLLTLASLSSLQSLTILHFRGLTPSGLSAALLACGGLSKVKLHASIKSSLLQPLFRYLEARGCSFQWRDKEFQAELDPKCWKLVREDTE